jgi:hypothetical protein
MSDGVIIMLGSKLRTNGKLHSKQTEDYSNPRLCSLECVTLWQHSKQWWILFSPTWLKGKEWLSTWMIFWSLQKTKRNFRNGRNRCFNDYENTISFWNQRNVNSTRRQWSILDLSFKKENCQWTRLNSAEFKTGLPRLWLNKSEDSLNSQTSIDDSSRSLAN